MVAAVVRAELVDPEDTADIVQDALLRAYTRLGELRTLDRFAPWLARIAASCARNRNTRHRLDARTDKGPAFSDRVTTPPSELTEQRELLDRGLRTLPRIQRTLLFMRYVSDASYAEIADALLITPEAAEIRARRALSSLREFYRRSGLESDCRVALRAYALAPLALGDLCAAVLERVSAAPDPTTRIPGRAALRALPFGALGGVVGALVLGSILRPSHVDFVGVTTATTDEIGVEVHRDLLRRPVALVRPEDRARGRRVLIAPERQLDGWQPIQPQNDASVPAPAPRQIGGRPRAGVAGNDFGVLRPFAPQSRVVGLSVWIRPSIAPMNATFGLAFRDPEGYRVPIIRKDETNRWFYAASKEAFGRVDGEGHMIRARYRVADATYSLWLDEELVVADTPVPAQYIGRKPQGVYIVSGRGGEPAPLYFDDLRVWADDFPANGARPLLRSRAVPAAMPRATLLSGTLNGARLDALVPTIALAPGEPIEGTVRVEIENTHGADAEFPVIVTPTWGDHRTGFSVVKGGASSGISVRDIAVRFVAPEEPGSHYIVVVGAAEESPAHVASGTAWASGEPRWENGTDVAAWPESLLAHASVGGSAWAPWINHRGTLYHVPVAIAAVRVFVGGPVAHRLR